MPKRNKSAATVSMRRQLSRYDIIRLLRANGTPMPWTARVYLNVEWSRSAREVDIDRDHPITVSTKPYDRKDRRP